MASGLDALPFGARTFVPLTIASLVSVTLGVAKPFGPLPLIEIGTIGSSRKSSSDEIMLASIKLPKSLSKVSAGTICPGTAEELALPVGLLNVPDRPIVIGTFLGS